MTLPEMVFASMAIPGVWPPVSVPGLGPVHDGGTTANLPLPDDWRTYDAVWLLIAEPPYQYEPVRESIVSRLLMAASVMLANQVDRTLRECEAGACDHVTVRKEPLPQDETWNDLCHVYVIRPAVGETSGMLRFDHRLIAEAMEETQVVLNALQPIAQARRVLFVRSGGGAPGIDIHIGIWRALEDAGIFATHCVGTSAGAVVSALDATGQTAIYWHWILNRLCDADFRRERILWKLRALWIDWFLDPAPMLRLLRRFLPARHDELVKPARFGVTRESTATMEWLPRE